MRTLLLVLAGVGLGIPAILYASARLSLDRSLAHTHKTEALPLLSNNERSGLVQIRARGQVFRARVAGLQNDGPALILLHGFPETSAMWAPLLEAAAAAGYRVVAFDQRGYSPGARPSGVARYAIAELREDVLAIADALDFEQFHLVGHDWGSIVGWGVTGEHPERVLSWASLSIPHPSAAQESRADQGAPAYVRMFRVPGVAETLLSFGGMAMLRRMNPALPPGQIDEYLAVFSEPGALTAALNWYRALGQGPLDLDAPEIVRPSLWIYGDREMQVFVNERVRELQRRYMKGPFEPIELEAGHWLMQEQTDLVVAAVMKHLAASRPSNGT